METNQYHKIPILKTLVINENVMLLKMLDTMLSRGGHEIYTIDNALEAYSAIDDLEPDLVIVDLMISYITGYELINHIRRQRSKYIKIIVLTRVSLDKVISEAFELGVDDYVLLPLQPQELLARISRLSKYQMAV